MKVTFLGHATLLIKTKLTTILVDPFITGNPLVKDKVNIDDLKPDYILITHAHQDHVLDVEVIAKQSDATIVSNYEIATYYEKKGFRVHPMNHGGAWNFDFGKLKYVNAIHTSTFADGTNGGQPGGFVLSADDKHIYIAGDTALHMDMKLIPYSYTLDLAILPIGDNFTMGVEDAIFASDFIECDTVLGYHYDTFGFIKIDQKEAKKRFLEEDKKLYLLAIGKSILI
ncbi:metal-dependent hydrolase [Cellulophaga sp. HaHaR_3_176]|uniref:metal-dependent hydrolase n=1 Tax=Cellulophaga sp. HaHaR_3_176 TaxID=1942464 RepID=UPI001C1F67F1|nr:metal-dependent hydrolase [Cellulophaga sp. HaHaR_3_176]QWX85466.1 metal-dependent hydrolase [Cellulophaga sp. HaHaR_3_176]